MSDTQQTTATPAWRNPFAIAWLLALIFYVLEYAARSAPAVMIPQLTLGFGRDSVGVSAILGSYYYTYSLASLAAGACLDRFGARYVVAFGALVLGIGCLLFQIENSTIAYGARLLQGAGSAFAFTGAVYLASRAFSANAIATAIGATQCMGMIGGAAGQFVVGPLLIAGVDWRLVWIVLGVASVFVAMALRAITPAVVQTAPVQASILAPFRVVLTNPQSYLCGLVAGLLFAPTTIGTMTWGVAFLQVDRAVPYGSAVSLAAMVPLGWAVGCPLLGWATDRIGLRKPVLRVGIVLLLLAIAQITFAPDLLSPYLSLLVAGIASGAAMIPYTIIKEANPDEVKGSATGAINFLTFGVTALIGPLFAALFGKTLLHAANPILHFERAGVFWLVAAVIALLLTTLLHETGKRHA
jgi:MFS family permease